MHTNLVRVVGYDVPACDWVDPNNPDNYCLSWLGHIEQGFMSKSPSGPHTPRYPQRSKKPMSVIDQMGLVKRA